MSSSSYFAIFSAAFLVVAMGAVVVVIRSSRRHPQPPPRPERLRQLAEGEPSGRRLAVRMAVGALPLLLIAVAAVLLIVLSEDDLGRTVGIVLAAWMGLILMLWVGFTVTVAIRGRRNPGAREAERERLLAESEAFWARPDAEERAKAMRRAANPFARR